MATDSLCVKKGWNETKIFNVFFLTKILVRGELALLNEHQLHLQFVTTPTIPSEFRRHFVGSKF